MGLDGKPQFRSKNVTRLQVCTSLQKVQSLTNDTSVHVFPISVLHELFIHLHKCLQFKDFVHCPVRSFNYQTSNDYTIENMHFMHA